MLPSTLIIMGSARSDGKTRKIIDELCTKIAADFIDLNDYKIVRSQVLKI